MLHALKIIQPYFDDVAAGKKPFEVRKMDRPYMVGDFLALNEWDGQDYTGRFVMAHVTYILEDNNFVKDEHAILGIVPAMIKSSEPIYNYKFEPCDKRKTYPVYGKIKEKLCSDPQCTTDTRRQKESIE